MLFDAIISTLVQRPPEPGGTIFELAGSLYRGRPMAGLFTARELRRRWPNRPPDEVA
jgi:hypothetical protein